MYAHPKSPTNELHPICKLRISESANLRPLFAALAVLSLCWVTLAASSSTTDRSKQIRVHSIGSTISRGHQVTGLASIGRWDR